MTLPTASADLTRAILTHAVFVGLTPLIPIPVLDDVVKSFFARSLIHSLANAHNLPLSDGEVTALAEERSRGCVSGCLFGSVEYVVKRLIRKIIFILEWRRAVDLVTHTYYVGRLMDYAFAQGWYEPGSAEQAARLRLAIETARAGANTTLGRNVVAATFRQSRALVVSAVTQLAAAIRDLASRRGRRRAGAEVEHDVAERLERETPQIRMTVGDLIERLQVNLGALPDDHFDLLQSRLEAALRESPPLTRSEVQ